MAKTAQLVCPDCHTEAVTVLGRRFCPDCREDLVVQADTWKGAEATPAAQRWIYSQKPHAMRGDVRWTA